MENQNVNVNENKGELTILNGNKQNVYCSKVAETEKEKKELFNALESCDALLNDCVGQEIEIKDIYVQVNHIFVQFSLIHYIFHNFLLHKFVHFHQII